MYALYIQNRVKVQKIFKPEKIGTHKFALLYVDWTLNIFNRFEIEIEICMTYSWRHFSQTPYDC